MNRIDQIARAVETICTLRPEYGPCAVFIDDETGDGTQRFELRIEPSRRSGEHPIWDQVSINGEHPIWDQVFINGHSCGNRHGGVHFLMVALGERPPRDDFSDRAAIAHRKTYLAVVADKKARV